MDLNPTYSPEVLSLLSSWADRPDAACDLREIFGATPEAGTSLLNKIRNQDLSWLPGIEILPSEILSPAIAAYARATASIYLSDACPVHLQSQALLEEIGHHIDALLNTEETPGDEGALFSASVRGLALSEEEINSILNEDDSALIFHQGSLVSVECIIPRGDTLPPAPHGPPANDTIYSALTGSSDNPTILPAHKHGLVGTGSKSAIISGSAKIKKNPIAYNYLGANSGNDTIIAGFAKVTTMVGGSGNNLFLGGSGDQSTFGTYTNYFRGGSGNSTMVAANGKATLIGGSGNNSLVAGTGNQSLVGGGGTNILVGGIGKDTLRGGTGTNSLFSRSTLTGGNTLIGGSGSNTLIAGHGKDSLLGGSGPNYLNAGLDTSKITLVGGTGANTLVAGSLAGGELLIGGQGANAFYVTSQAQADQIGNDTISFSSHSSPSLNSLALAAGGISIQDSLFAHVKAGSLSAVVDLNSSAANSIILGSLAQNAGITSLVSGTASDTLSVAAYTASALLDGSRALSRVSLVGSTSTVSGPGLDTFLGSINGYDTMVGSALGGDLFVLQNTSGTSSLTGISPTLPGSLYANTLADTLQINRNAALNYQTFNALTGISVLSLSGGTSLASGINTVGSLQGSGITTIIGGAGVNSDVISASVSALIQAATPANSSTITLALQSGASGTMGFAANQFLSGNGIQNGTYITAVSAPANGTINLTLSQPTSAFISQGTLINGYLNGISIIGSVSGGQNATKDQGAAAQEAVKNLSNASNGFYQQNIGVPNELALDVQAFLAQQSNPLSYIHTQGDSLVVGGTGELVLGAISTTPDSLVGSYNIEDTHHNKETGIPFYSHVVADNTIVSGMFNNSGTAPLFGEQNTLVGGPGANTYILNNLPGDTLLPTILNLSSIQSGSTIQFTTNSVQLTDSSFANVGARTAQVFKTANGNNLIELGQYGAQIGIQTIIGGIGADTFATIPTLDGNGNSVPYQQAVYFDGSRGTGAQTQSMVSGSGNDTILGGNGNSILQGGSGNNSMIGGSGSNILQSGIGNSTLDGGLGASTMQAAGGTNLFIVRNRFDVILGADETSIPNPYASLAGVAAEVSNVDSYVNFDPIQASPYYDQFAPDYPDGSPSITKSISFASADLASFYQMANFTLDAGAGYGGATYGVGNALNNNIATNGTLSHLVLGMGGNNTLVGSASGDSLYGYVNSTYANPDLYAAAPYDTRTQNFINGVIGTAGNNSIVANGANSYLDGGPGYNDGLGVSSGSNTLIGTKGGDTFFVRNQADSVVAAGGGNELISSVDLHSIANNINRATLLVTKQAPNLPNIDPNNLTLPANTGQTDPATFLGFGNGVPNSSASDAFKDQALLITVPNSTRLDFQYGTAEGQQYENVNGEVPVDTLTGETLIGYNGQPMQAISISGPFPSQTGDSYTLSWDAPTTGGTVVGYSVYYKLQYADGTSSPWKTYVNGTSQDLTGSVDKPSLIVDGLPTSDTLSTGTIESVTGYDFQVTAQQLTQPTTTDPNTGLIKPTPVTLQGSNNNDVIWAFMPAESLFGGALVGYDSNAPILTNNSSQTPNGTFFPTQPDSATADRYPVYMDAQNGNDLFVTQQIGNGDGSDYTVGGITYTGLDTMVGGIGSDTFIVSNGDTTFYNGVVTNGPYGFDRCIKYGNETPVNYAAAPGATTTDPSGVSLNGGQHNLIVSYLSAIQLSDQVVSQGMFVDELLVNGSGNFGEGNRLDNLVYDVNAKNGANTLVGSTGRDSIAGIGRGDVLIGGTATGKDSIAGALADYQANTTNSVSIYRDTDPTPSNAVTGGPGNADPSQYWTQNARLGGLVYNYLGNSDTLIATDGGDSSGKATLDGGAGNDSMIGGVGNDAFYVSSGGALTLIGGILTNLYNDGYNGGTSGGIQADVVAGGGGNDTVIFTGSDVYWSSLTGATNAQLGYTLSNSGDSAGTQSISNITLQMSDPIARAATGNSASTGNATLGATYQFSGTEIGSNILVGNEYGATFNGGGVGGTDLLGNYGDGTGIGLDSLIGNAGNSTGGYAVSPSVITKLPVTVTGTADTFVINQKTTVRAQNYTGSSSDVVASVTTLVPSLAGGGSDTLHTAITGITTYATDEDYAVINVKNSSVDSLPSGGATIELASGVTYLIGSIPSTSQTTNKTGGYSGATSFGNYNINAGYLHNLDDTLKPGPIGLSGVPSTDAKSTEFGIYALTSDKAGNPVPNLVAVVLGIPLDYLDSTGSDLNYYSFQSTPNSTPLIADGQDLSVSMGGRYSSSVLYDNGALPTAENFAGMGAFYKLNGTNFATQHVVSV